MSCFWKYAYFSDIVDQSDDVWYEILASSRKNNRAVGVTGIIVRDKTTYFQYIEGQKASVSDCVLRIAGDRRHNHVTSVISAYTEALFFDGWYMAEARIPLRRYNLSSFKRLLLRVPMKDRINMINQLCLDARLYK